MTPGPSATVVQSLQADDSDFIDFRPFLLRLLANKLLMTISLISAITLAGLLYFLATPIYRATVIMLPSTSDRNALSSTLNSALGQFGGLASIAGLGGSSGDQASEEALAVLRSRQFAESFISDHNLLPRFFPEKWDAEKKRWKPDVREPTPARAYKYFDRRVRSVTQDKKTGLVTVQVDWKDRIEAADWANELVLRLNKEMRQRAIKKADVSMGYLHDELKEAQEVEARSAISRLIESEIKRRMLANVTEEYAFRVVDRALPPDKDDSVRPSKPVYAVAGFFGGIFLGILLVTRYGRKPI